jgi:RAD51-like protein 1
MSGDHYSLRRCGLNEKVVFLLESKKIRTAYDVLRLSPLDLVQLVGVPLVRAEEIRRSVSSSLSSKLDRTTAMHMKEVEQRDPRSARTGVRALDEALKGGLRAGTITEIVGPPGSCKSQVCLQVALLAALPRNLGGLEGKVLYFDGGNHFRVERLAEMSQARFPDASSSDLNALLRQILVSNLFTLSDLEGLLPNLERTVLEHNIRTIIIDDIAHLARTEYTARESIFERQRVLGKIASHLKKVACDYRIPVLIVNQVMSVRDFRGSHGNGNGKANNVNDHIGSVMRISPEMDTLHYNTALGAKWAHYINTRITFLRHSFTSGGGSTVGGRMHLVKSPFAPETTIHFRTTRLGVTETEEEEQQQEEEENYFDAGAMDISVHRPLLLEYL